MNRRIIFVLLRNNKTIKSNYNNCVISVISYKWLVLVCNIHYYEYYVKHCAIKRNEKKIKWPPFWHEKKTPFFFPSEISKVWWPLSMVKFVCKNIQRKEFLEGRYLPPTPLRYQREDFLLGHLRVKSRPFEELQKDHWHTICEPRGREK